MKAKISRGDGFRGCLEYILGKETAECIGGTVIGTDAAEMGREYRATIPTERESIKKPVWHTSLTLPAGEKLSDEKWLDVASSYLDKMGMSEDRAYTIVRHGDTDHDHVHILASRVALDGNLWYGQHEAYKAMAATQKLEKEYGLTQTKGYSGEKKAERRASPNETERTLRTEEVSAKTAIKNAVTATLKKPCTWKEFEVALNLQGITTVLHEQKTGRIYGVSYETAGVAVKGSKLGKAYSLNGLANRGVDFEQDRAGERDRQEGYTAEVGAYRSSSELGANDAAATHRDTIGIDADRGITAADGGSDSGKDSSYMAVGTEIAELQKFAQSTRAINRFDSEADESGQVDQKQNIDSDGSSRIDRGYLEQLGDHRSKSRTGLLATHPYSVSRAAERAINTHKLADAEKKRQDEVAAKKVAEAEKILKKEEQERQQEAKKILRERERLAEEKRLIERKKERERINRGRDYEREI